MVIALASFGCAGPGTPGREDGESGDANDASAYVTVPIDSDEPDTAPDSTAIDETGDTGQPPNPDADYDGFDAIAYGGTDCDDGNVYVYPGAPEMCDAADQDCDGNGWTGADCAETQNLAAMGQALAGSPWGMPTIVRDVTGDGIDDVLDGSYRNGSVTGLAYWTATEIPEDPGYFPEDNNVAAFYPYSDLIDHRLDFGDVDGDGYNDVGHVPGGVYGYTTSLFRGPIPTDGSWVYAPDYAWGASPSMVWSDCWSCEAITGDWNGDGLGDLALSAWDDLEPEEDGGLVVYWGGTFGDERLTLSGGHIKGLDALGDVNGDGTDDMAVQDPSQGSRETVVAWINGADLSLAMELADPIDVAFARVIDEAYENSAWSGVRDWDGDGLVDPEAVIYPGGGDVDAEAELLAFSAATSTAMAIDDAIGGYDLPGTALDGGARGQACNFGGADHVLYQSGQTWALFEAPATLPPRHSPFPERMLVLEEALDADCGDVTGDGRDDLVFGVDQSWLDAGQIRVIPGWEIPWDDDTYWP